jgi:dihydrofolate synthase/folylpolyglutamate synthase
MASIPTPHSLADYVSVRHYLYGLKHHGAKFGIDRMRLLAARLGDPQRCFPVVHVAGTNGKGSVAAMLESAFRRAGLRTGLYTSPHLVHQGERVQVNRVRLTEDEIVAYVRELQPVAAALGAADPDDHPSFFEFMTAMAFLHFARRGVDVGIIEVGLGGRLDATNVVEPLVSIVTSISLDHTEVLGDTVAMIAREKAGIVKPGRPVVIGALPAEAEAVVREIARERGCVVHAVREVFGEDSDALPETNLSGGFQRVNAATAMLALRVVSDRFPVSEGVAREALRDVDWPGRWQRLAVAGREMIFDAAHNPEGAQCLAENLERFVRLTGRRPHAVVGVLGKARAAAILPVVARYAETIHLVEVPHQPRACSLVELRPLVPEEFTGTVATSTLDALFPSAGICGVGGPNDAVLVTGSIYLLGEVMDRLLHEKRLEQGRLQD